MDRTSPGRETAGLVPRVLGTFVGIAAASPRASLGLSAVLAVLSLGVAAFRIDFTTNSTGRGEFGDQREIVVVVEARDASTIRAVMDDVAGRIEADSQHFQNTLHRVDSNALKSKGLQYLSPTVLENVAAHLEVYAPVIEGQWQRAGLDPYCQNLGHFLTRADRAGQTGDQASLLGQCLRLAESLEAFSRNPRDPAAFVSPWSPIVEVTAAAPATDVSVLRFVNARGTMGSLVTMPRGGDRDSYAVSAAIDRLREIVRIVQAERETENVRAGITGISVIEHDEATRWCRDVAWASFFALTSVGLILLIAFRSVRHAVLPLVTMATGIAWTLGVITLGVGHPTIEILSAATIPAALGIGLAVYFQSRYLTLRHAGLDVIDAIERTGETTGRALLTCTLATALALGTAAFTGDRGMADLGIVAATGIACCGLSVLCVLPALIAVTDGRQAVHHPPQPFQARALRRVVREIPWPLSMAGLCLAIGCAVAAFEWEDGRPSFRVRYDGNELHRQADGSPAVDWQERLFRESGNSLLHAVSMASSPAEARRLKERLEALPGVSRVEEVASLMPAYPASETQLLVQATHARLSRLTDISADVPMVDPQSVGQKLDDLYATLSKRTDPAVQSAAVRLDRFLDTLSSLSTARQASLLNEYQRAMLVALHAQFARLGAISDPVAVSPEELPSGLKTRFVDPAGNWLLRVHPAEQIWEADALASFVGEVRSVDPEITGTPIQHFETARQLRESYLNAAIYALVIVAIVLLLEALRPGPKCLVLLAPVAVIAFAVWIRRDGASILDRPASVSLLALAVSVAVAAVLDLRNLAMALTALLPPVLGGAMLLGAMAVLNIDFHPGHRLALPLLLSFGVVFGVMVVHEFRSSREEFCLSGSTAIAVLVTALATMASFGSLLVATHRGLASLGLVVVLGMAGLTFMTLIPLQALLTAVSQRRQQMPLSSPGRLNLVEPVSSRLSSSHFPDVRNISVPRG